jgi:hypothetical protein
MSVLASAEGMNRNVELHENKIVLKRKGLLSFVSEGLGGDKEILIKRISSIQFKKASFLAYGHMAFTFDGGQDVNRSLFDENGVTFNSGQQADFLKLRTAIEDRMNSLQDSGKQTSELDELEKLASLRDKMIITESEFQAKKKKILGL